MTQTSIAVFLSLKGRAAEAISFYQRVFEGEVRFQITNREYQARLDNNLVIPDGQADWVAHSIVQVGALQLQIADNPVIDGVATTTGTAVSFSVSVADVVTAQCMYERLVAHADTAVLQAPTTNAFADFYAVVRDPFGMLIQLSKEQRPDPNDK